MNELKIWMLVGVAGVMATVLGFCIEVERAADQATGRNSEQAKATNTVD